MSLNFPVNPVDGQVYSSYTYSSATGAWKGREESATVAITSPTAPTSAKSGDIWINTNTGASYFYYGDGDSNQWVEILSSTISSVADKANIDSPIFTGTVSLPSTTSIGTVSNIELSYVDGVTSSIQTQLNSKANLSGATFTGAISGTSANLSGSINAVQIVGQTPVNSGSTGGIAIKAPASGTQTSGYLQFVNNTYTAQWGAIESTSAGVMNLSATYVRSPNNPAFRAYYPSAAAGAATISFSGNDVGFNGRNSGWNGVNRFTVPIAGVYVFSFAILVNPTIARINFRINGSASTNYGETLIDGYNSYASPSMSMAFKLNANDYVELYNEQASVYGTPYGSFSGFFLG